MPISLVLYFCEGLAVQDKELRLLMTQNRLTVNDFDPEKQRYVEKSKAQKAAGARLLSPGPECQSCALAHLWPAAGMHSGGVGAALPGPPEPAAPKRRKPLLFEWLVASLGGLTSILLGWCRQRRAARKR